MTWVRWNVEAFRVDDRIRFTCEVNNERVEGTVRGTGYEPDALHVARDDGEVGMGLEGTWLVAGGDNGQLYKWVEEITEHWEATTIDQLAVGDRVTFWEYNEQEDITGTVTHRHGNTEVTVERDDGRRGGGRRGLWWAGVTNTTNIRRLVNGPPPVVQEEWQDVEFHEIRAGDRVECTYLGERPYLGRVLRAEGDVLHVARDDARHGGGDIDPATVIRSWLVGASGMRFRRWTRGATPEEIAERPMRAALCDCCGLPTGEYTNGTPEQQFCVGCRALPVPWGRGGIARDGLLNNGEGGTPYETTRMMRRDRLQAMGADGARPTAARAPAFQNPFLDYAEPTDDDEEEEDEQPAYRCEHCDGCEFRVDGVRETNVPPLYGGYRDMWDYVEGDTITFYVERDDCGDLDTDGARVVCVGCAEQNRDITFDVEWA